MLTVQSAALVPILWKEKNHTCGGAQRRVVKVSFLWEMVASSVEATLAWTKLWSLLIGGQEEVQ